jgi:hypothetical protein
MSDMDVLLQAGSFAHTAARVLVVVALLSSAARAQTQDASGPEAISAEFAGYMLDAPLLDPVAPYSLQEAPFYEKQAKPGMLQQVYQSTTVIQADSNELPITELDFSFTLGFPLPTRDSPLLVTPYFGLDLLQADALDLPSEFYDASVEFRYLRPWGDCWMFDFAVQPGVYGNTETEETVFRTQGRAVAIYQWSATAKVLAGGTYLDREDIQFLPIAGVIWTPSDDWKLELLFPRPRVAVRAYRDCCSAWWLYLSGELGGGSWGVTRTGGAADVATLTDVRFTVGMEREHACLSGKIEAGYVFARELEYQSGVGDQDLESAALFRVVLYY